MLGNLTGILSEAEAVYIARLGLFFWTVKRISYVEFASGTENLVRCSMRCLSFYPACNEFFLPTSLKQLALSEKTIPVSEQLVIASLFEKLHGITECDGYIFLRGADTRSYLRVWHPPSTIASEKMNVSLEDIQIAIEESAIKIASEFISKSKEARILHVEGNGREFIFSLGFSNIVGFEIFSYVDKNNLFEILDLVFSKNFKENSGAFLNGAITESVHGNFFYATKDFTKTFKWQGKPRCVVSFFPVTEEEIELAKLVGKRLFFEYLLSEKIAADVSDYEVFTCRDPFKQLGEANSRTHVAGSSWD